MWRTKRKQSMKLYIRSENRAGDGQQWTQIAAPSDENWIKRSSICQRIVMEIWDGTTCDRPLNNGSRPNLRVVSPERARSSTTKWWRVRTNNTENARRENYFHKWDFLRVLRKKLKLWFVVFFECCEAIKTNVYIFLSKIIYWSRERTGLSVS